MKGGQLDDLIALSFKERNSGNGKRIGWLLGKERKGIVKFPFGARLENTNLPAEFPGRLRSALRQAPERRHVGASPGQPA